MEESTLEAFKGHLAGIGAVDSELGRIEDDQLLSGLPTIAEFRDRWPVIESDMGRMLATIEGSLDNFAAVDALPPFAMFPWFFVVPGIMAVALGWLAFRRPWVSWLLAGLGIGLVAAPGIFQMWTRAPLGGEMIDDFRPLMTTARVTEIQKYFLTLGGAEGELRNDLRPRLEVGQFPSIAAFGRDWPRIAGDMAPMVGAMSDNVDNFKAVDDLPPFPAFPWFFVAPGALIFLVSLGGSSLRFRPGVFTRVGAGLLLVLAMASCTGSVGTGGGSGEDFVGLFKLTGGECTAGEAVTGSYFRMVQPGGDVDKGPFVGNNDSPCSGDKFVTPLIPGSDGGLVTGEYQPNPNPPFDETGNAAASRITQPATWFAVRFSLATNPRDPQTGLDVPAPSIRLNDGRLSGDIRSFAAVWNGQHFNQGTPKPDGSRPGNTSELAGTYEDSAKTFTLDWTTQIIGGPFNNFTGTWHLEGTFSANTFSGFAVAFSG